MTSKLQQYLNEYPRKTISIGITADGVPLSNTPVPWMSTTNAYNMHTPDLYLSPADLEDPVVWEKLGSLEVVGCYIRDPLLDYSFLARLTELRDLNIYYGSNLTDISFMSTLKKCRMFYLEDATLDDLEPMFPPDHTLRDLRAYCLCLLNCKIRDISAVKQNAERLNELVIYQPKGTDEASRWVEIPLRHKYYFEYEEKK